MSGGASNNNVDVLFFSPKSIHGARNKEFMVKDMVQRFQTVSPLILALLLISSNSSSFAEQGADIGKMSSVKTTLATGPLLELRLKVSNRIEEAAQRGVGVKPYQKAFENIEASVVAGEREESIKPRLDSLAIAIERQFTVQDSSMATNTSMKDGVWHPYTTELVRRLRTNWHPPSSQSDSRVVVMFDLMKDGTLTKCKVTQSSGIPKIDQAALKAVADTTPYKPWPADSAVKKNENAVSFQQTFEARSPHLSNFRRF